MASDTLLSPSRLAAGNNPGLRGGRYDGFHMLLHWLTALLVVIQFGLAQAWGFLPRGSDPRHALQSLHVSFGAVLIVVIATRLIWRVTGARRPPPADGGPIGWVASTVHATLYALLLVIAATGLGNLWVGGQGLGVFGLFTIPSPFAGDKAWQNAIYQTHHWAAWGVVGLAGLHATAALFHHYGLHDGVLRRMLPARTQG